MNINWRKIQVVSSWIIFFIGCMPALILLIGVVVLGLLAIICVGPGILLAPNQSLHLGNRSASVEKGAWNWDRLNNRGEDHG